MKNSTFPLIFFLLFGLSSFAQRIGIKAGGNFTNVIGNDGNAGKLEGHKYIPGFHVGILGQIDLAETISLQMEACYSAKGFQLKKSSSTTILNTTITQEYDVKYTYSYLDLPLLLNIHFGQMGSYVGLGPQLSFLMGAKHDGKITNTTTITSPPPPMSTTTELTYAGKDSLDSYSKTDFGFAIGTGAKWESGIEYCLRAYYGLGNLINPNVSKSKEVWHNLVFSVSLGYTFGAGGGGGGDRYGHKYNKPKRRR